MNRQEEKDSRRIFTIIIAFIPSSIKLPFIMQNGLKNDVLLNTIKVSFLGFTGFLPSGVDNSRDEGFSISNHCLCFVWHTIDFGS